MASYYPLASLNWENKERRGAYIRYPKGIAVLRTRYKDTGDFVKTITDDLYSNGKFGIWKKVESFGIIERVEETR